MNNLKLLAQGKVVTDKHVEALLDHETKTKLEPIFNEALGNNHPSESSTGTHHTAKIIKNDLKMTADLSTLLEKASKGKSSDGVNATHTNYATNSLILNYKVALEKYEPLDLLRASEFEKHGVDLPAEKQVQKDTKALFMEFLEVRHPTPKTPEDLKKAYKEFVDVQVAKFKANPSGMQAELKAAQEDKSLKVYIGFVGMGAKPALAAQQKGVDEMHAIKELQGAREKKFVEEMKDDFDKFKKEKDPFEKGENLKTMYNKEFEGVPVFKNIIEKMQTTENATFIIDVINMKQSGIGDKAIKAEYIDNGSPSEINIPQKDRAEVLKNFADGQNDMKVFDNAYSKVMRMFDENTVWSGMEKYVDFKPVEKREEITKTMRSALHDIETAGELDVNAMKQPDSVNKPKSKMIDLSALSDDGSNPFGKF
jgi:hypothetical protein